MSSDWNNRLTYHCFPIFWSSTFFGSSSPTLPAGFLTYRSTLCQTFSHGSPTQWLPSKISGIWHHSLLTVTGSLRTLTWFPIILATTIVLRHWKTLSKPSITKNQKMSSSCPKIHLADGKKVVRGILWSTLSPSAKTQNRSRPWRDWQPFASAFSKDEIRHLRRLSRGSADPREHSRSWWLVHRFVNNCILHVGYGFECAVQKT